MKHFLPRRSLSYLEWLLLPEAFFQLTIAWIYVKSVPSKKYLGELKATDFTISHIPKGLDKAKRIAGIINGLAIRTPWMSTCLIKALAAHRMLQNREIGHRLHFGVSRNLETNLEAHAWLSVNGKVLVGGENHESFVEISGGS